MLLNFPQTHCNGVLLKRSTSYQICHWRTVEASKRITREQQKQANDSPENSRSNQMCHQRAGQGSNQMCYPRTVQGCKQLCHQRAVQAGPRWYVHHHKGTHRWKSHSPERRGHLSPWVWLEFWQQ